MTLQHVAVILKYSQYANPDEVCPSNGSREGSLPASISPATFVTRKGLLARVCNRGTSVSCPAPEEGRGACPGWQDRGLRHGTGLTRALMAKEMLSFLERPVAVGAGVHVPHHSRLGVTRLRCGTAPVNCRGIWGLLGGRGGGIGRKALASPTTTSNTPRGIVYAGSSYVVVASRKSFLSAAGQAGASTWRTVASRLFTADP